MPNTTIFNRQILTYLISLTETLDNYKTINHQLEYAQQQLLDGNKTKEEMFAIILHELWSPLNFIAATSGRMVKDKGNFNTDEHFSYLATLHNSANDIVQLTEQLLKWMRSQHGAFKLNIKQASAYALLADIVKLYKEIALQRGNQITIDYKPDATIVTDPAVLTLIIRNIVHNVNKNTKNGEIVLRYTVNNAGVKVIAVSDTGRGMEQEKIDEIMQLAGQDTLKSSSLGFRLAFEFSKLVNASINVSSVIGKGTTVSIFLPIEDAGLKDGK